MKVIHNIFANSNSHSGELKTLRRSVHGAGNDLQENEMQEREMMNWPVKTALSDPCGLIL